MSRLARLIASLALVGAPLAAAQPAAAQGGVPKSMLPPPDCEWHVGYDREATLPGYLLPNAKGDGQVCVPFTVSAETPPEGYKGDFYVNEFTMEKLTARWEACKKDLNCHTRLSRHIKRRAPPHREKFITDPQLLHALGKIDADNPNVDLRTIRRPAFFAREPYRESVAQLDARTYTVEFTAPVEPHERIHKGMSGTIKLRGWYLQGEGVPDGKGRKTRALIFMNMGGGGRLTALDDPKDALYKIDEKSGHALLNPYPSPTTGSTGQRDWRRYMYRLQQAGFDVLCLDRRGVGVSGGFSDTNTIQQGRDILQVIQDLRTGAGIRALSPTGEVLEGRAAAQALMAGADAAKLPVILQGNSRGTMSASWAMTRNFDKACDYDLPGWPCRPAVGLTNIKGAMLMSDYSSGSGYVTAPTDQADADRNLYIPGSAERLNIVFFPSSETLAGIHKWPALLIARGLWDYAESLEGSMDSVLRVKGPTELVVVRAPHAFETWPQPEQVRVADRMIAFATAAVQGKKVVPGARPWKDRKELVATSSSVWEPATAPVNEPTATERID